MMLENELGFARNKLNYHELFKRSSDSKPYILTPLFLS
jgi:hypothetical protein